MPFTVRPAAPAEYDAVGALTAGVYGGEGLAGSAYVEILRDARGRGAGAWRLVVWTKPVTGRRPPGDERLGSPVLPKRGRNPRPDTVFLA